MQYSTPQFIDREQKLLGPLTVRQTLILGLAAFILVAAYFLLNFFVFTMVAVVIGSLGFGIAFIKINDRPLYFVITAFIGYFANPKKYLWQKRKDYATFNLPEVKKTQSTEEVKPKLKKITEKDIESLAEFLDK